MKSSRKASWQALGRSGSILDAWAQLEPPFHGMLFAHFICLTIVILLQMLVRAHVAANTNVSRSCQVAHCQMRSSRKASWQALELEPGASTCNAMRRNPMHSKALSRLLTRIAWTRKACRRVNPHRMRSRFPAAEAPMHLKRLPFQEGSELSQHAAGHWHTLQGCQKPGGQ